MITDVGVKRFASAPVFLSFILLGSWGTFGPVAVASADSDLFVVDGVFGGTVSKYSGQRKWQPSLWLDATYRVAGPLHLGGYFQWLGKDWPLDEPGLGGGGLITLRTNIKKLSLSAAFGGGYLRVPLPDAVEGSGTISAFVGLGYGFLSWMGLEVRGRWMRYFKMPTDAPEQAWTIEAGFSFFID